MFTFLIPVCVGNFFKLLSLGNEDQSKKFEVCFVTTFHAKPFFTQHEFFRTLTAAFNALQPQTELILMKPIQDSRLGGPDRKVYSCRFLTQRYPLFALHKDCLRDSGRICQLDQSRQQAQPLASQDTFAFERQLGKAPNTQFETMLARMQSLTIKLKHFCSSQSS